MAIKSVILQKLTGKLKAALFDEINILKGLHHPHIVALYDCIESQTRIHLIMEYCIWGDLSVFLRKRETVARQPDLMDMFKKYPNPKAGGFNEVVVRHFLQQLASALHFLRSKSLVHRDIKPQNLLINPTAQYLAERNADSGKHAMNDKTAITPLTGLASLPMLKLADFGFARVLPKTSLAETLCGSPLYMAPEILRYEKYDATADLWSVGTVLYELLTGRPPFRAANHIDLLRKVEQARDVIRFPEEPVVSPELKEFIRALLKRNSVERMGFNDFFDSRLIKAEIPGIVEEDRVKPKPSRRDSLKPAAEQRSNDSHGQKKISPQRSLEESSASDKFVDAVDYVGRPPARRPSITHTATAPAGYAQTQRKQAPQPVHPQIASRDVTSAAQMQRRRTESISNTLKTPKDQPSATQAARQAREAREMQEQAANDVAFERDYVVVEKRAVEVNAFADELAASPRIGGAKKGEVPQTALQRRNTTQNASSGSASGAHAVSNKALAIVSGKKPEHLRQPSFEKRTRIGTSAISKAINMASGRLLNLGLSPPLGSGRSGPSPPLYAPFPAYPTPTATPLLLEDGTKNTTPIDEDTKTLQIVEEYAHRSDVVYGFAEVKYKQLIPLAPSEDHGLGLQEVGIPDKEDGSKEDGGLTVDAVVALSEEAMVLYVKSMSLLARATDIAGMWWTKKTRGDTAEESGSNQRTQTPSVNVAAATRVNKVVQWIRDRFNETWEKTDFVRLRLVAAQKRLPSDHPMHSTNQSTISSSTISGSSDSVRISPGVSAEKIMYARALEMGRGAAVNELVGEDLPGCDVSYVTAIRLLEAVLENDDEIGSKKLIASEKEQTGSGADSDDLVNAEDRAAVVKGKLMFATQRKGACLRIQIVIQSFRSRLIALRKKVKALSERPVASNPTPKPSSRSPASRSPASKSPVAAVLQLHHAGASSH